MKIKPVILCGGSGTRLWGKSKKNIAKQFIDFGGWSLIQKTLERVKNPIFDYPIISTNLKYLKQIRQSLKKTKINKYKIVLEPSKKNTAPAILSSALIKDIPESQPLLYLSADHLLSKASKFNQEIKKNKELLTNKNIFIFGIKPTSVSDQFGYFLTKKVKKNYNRVIKFYEKPKKNIAQKLIKKGSYWNSGIFYSRKDSIIYNFKKYQKKMFQNSFSAVKKSKFKKDVYYLNKNVFNKNPSKSFDYAILEKTKEINSINLNIFWSDLGSWREILTMFYNNRSKYFNKEKVFYRPWGKYTNLYNGDGFLIKELVINSKSSISLQKHNFRSEHWTVVSGNPLITINKKKFLKKTNQTVFVPKGSVHRIENKYNKPVVIMEVQLGSVLKESDIIRYKDIYGRIK